MTLKEAYLLGVHDVTMGLEVNANKVEDPPAPKPLKDLGTANGWGVFSPRPPEIDAHNAAAKLDSKAHTETWKPAGRNYTRGTCQTCGITWTVDSSD